MTIFINAVAIDENNLQKLGYDTHAIPYHIAFDKQIVIQEWHTPNRKLSSPVWTSLLHFRTYMDYYDDSIIKVCGGQDVSPIYKLDKNTINILKNIFHKINDDMNILIDNTDREAYNESLSLFDWASAILDTAETSDTQIIILLIPDI